MQVRVWHTQWMLIRSGTSLFMIAAIPLCLPIIAPAPSVTQLFIFFSSSWQSSTIFLRHLANSCPVAALVICSVCKKSVWGIPLALTYFTKTANCWSTDMSVTSSARQPNTSEDPVTSKNRQNWRLLIFLYFLNRYLQLSGKSYLIWKVIEQAFREKKFIQNKTFWNVIP